MSALGAKITDRGTTPGVYRPHPHAELFPMIEGPAFWDLVEDIREHGIREPVVMLDGMVLDGRNRYLAARECRANIPTVEYEGDDPLGFVISLNLKRRHLSESQRAMVAAKIAKLPQGARTDLQPSANLREVSVSQAAALLNVSERTVTSARSVHDHGTPALVASVEAGQATVSAAAEVAKLPETEQVAVVEQGPEAIREVASVQRADLPDEEKAARREAIVAGALRAGRGGGASRRNPHHVPDPAYDAALTLADCAGSVADLFADKGAAFILAGFIDAAMRERCLARISAGRDALSQFLEAAHAQ